MDISVNRKLTLWRIRYKIFWSDPVSNLFLFSAQEGAYVIKDVRNFVIFFWNVRKAIIYEMSQSFCECIRMQIFDIKKFGKMFWNYIQLYTILHNYTHCYEMLQIDAKFRISHSNAKCKKVKFRICMRKSYVTFSIYEFVKKNSSFAHPCTL